jgi:poly(hydroxyalkanoate) depolymerase family esterase
MHIPAGRFSVPLARFSPQASAGRLDRLAQFGSNPGNLNAWYYAPEAASEPCPLVVVLHGCTQTAKGYDHGSGWSELAEGYGFAVVFPEQQRANNANLCFNWFEPGHTRRDKGEALSIAKMIDAMVELHGVDPARVFITGLSAGGAMTSVMLATYPEKFAGGAILAGLPHGAAASVPEALQQMRSHTPTPRSSGRSITEASPHAKRWPSVAIWHGTADAVVDPSNSDAILRQWQDVHGLQGPPSETDRVDGHPHRVWRDGSGAVMIEDYRVTGMGHGAALATGGECGCGEAGAFMLEVGISSTVRSAQAWGLLGTRMRPSRTPAATREPTPAAPAPHEVGGVGKVIEDALRAAGLMK